MIKLTEIINHLEPIKTMGNLKKEISSIKSIEDIKSFDDNSICWINSKNIKTIEQLNCGTIICSNTDNIIVNDNCTIIIVEDPRKAFAKIMNIFFKEDEPITIHNSAIIDNSVKIGQNVSIGPYTIIEKSCVIGDNVTIGANNVIKRKTIIEENVKIGSNNTIGDLGFGYEKDDSGFYQRIQHIGNVFIQKNVEISNNVCIDRAVLGSTIIGENSKIDNLVHIAHGVKIGKNTLIIANSMIAGSTTIGDNVWIAPSSSILNKLYINDNSVIGMGTVVLKDVEMNSIIAGNPGRKLIKKL
jgi:UDP-3-O-[3-hydroxymyristoyl] glucosamine N-acyltransferase